LFSFEIIPYTLHFNFKASTSRGVLKGKKTWVLKLTHADFSGRIGWGEAGLLPGLSPENAETFEADLRELATFLISKLLTKPRQWENISSVWMEGCQGKWLPSAWFAFETAWLDWVNGGNQLICDPVFWAGEWRVPINGLVWMNPIKTMQQKAIEKRKDGFDTIKLKIGALDWNHELEMISKIREEMPGSEVKIRLDVNGAWKPDEADKKLFQLEQFNIESIEQPIETNHWKAMAELCRNSPIPIALDEELIGKPLDHQKYSLLESIEPQFIVIKPSLVGGLGQSHQWIKMAEDLGIGWWITSMLESNIGLNAIAQLAAQYRPTLPQGLGTGKIYSNNIDSPLSLQNGELFYSKDANWDFTQIL